MTKKKYSGQPGGKEDYNYTGNAARLLSDISAETQDKKEWKEIFKFLKERKHLPGILTS